MNLIDVTKTYPTKEACLEKLEKLRWPSGKVCCIKCGIYEQDGKPTVTKMILAASQRKNGKVIPARRLYQCNVKECKYQFSVTEGTVFHRSHIDLQKWFVATALILQAKKGISSLQVGRHLGVSEKNTKSTWFLCHRIREAAKEAGILLEGIVEADHTYMTPKKPRKGKPYKKKETTDVVLGMIERGGDLRLVPLKDAKMKMTEAAMDKHIDPNAILHTDEHAVFSIIGGRKFPGRHRMINHTVSYGVGDLHTNTVENAFSLLKRGIYGNYHQVSIKHLGRYCNEFSYRFNRRNQQAQMFEETLKRLVNGKPLQFKTLISSGESEEF
jgi:ISXO2-like transposase domain